MITVCLSAKNVHLGNFWTGSWRSVFEVSVAEEGKATLSCRLNIGSHYFEDGNVQLNTEKKKEIQIEVTSVCVLCLALCIVLCVEILAELYFNVSLSFLLFFVMVYISPSLSLHLSLSSHCDVM